MTQSTYSGTTDSKQDNSDELSSGEIRADIDQTRASVGDKIDQLQARLDPNRLKQQAQDTVQEMLTDTANSMTDYVRTHKDEMVNSLTDAARRNPLPTALIGLGLGWLILESMGGSKQDNRRYDSRTDPYSDAPRYSPRNNQNYYAGNTSRFDEQRWQEAWRDPNLEASERSRFEGSTGRSYVSQGRGQYDAPDYGRAGYEGRSGYSGHPEAQGQYTSMGNGGNGHQGGQQSGNPIAKAASAVKDSASGAADSVKDVAGDVKDKVVGTVSDATQQVKEGISNIAEQIGDKVGDVREQVSRMGEQGQRTMSQAGGQMEDWQERARYESYQARHMAQRYAQSGSRQVKRNLEDNPLIYGAVALAAGAAIAMLLPQSRAENRAFGEMRDQMMAKGQEALETVKEHATTVIEEVRPELEEKARQIVDDATQAGKEAVRSATEVGKEAVKSATEELKPVVDKAISKGKEEARSAAQEVGVDPSKLTVGTSATSSTTPSAQTSGMSQGSSSQAKPLIINRDTMKGQWKQVQGEVKKQWGQLTDDDLLKAEGNYDKLAGSIQQRYGYTRERVDRELNAFFDSHKG